jgi:predicted permease
VTPLPTAVVVVTRTHPLTRGCAIHKISMAQSPMAEIASALLRIWMLVGLGYYCKARGIISDELKKGIAVMTGTIVLPALLFYFLGTKVDFSTVSWAGLQAVALGKLCIFGVAALFGFLLRSKEDTAMSTAAIFGFFCTQSSDAAFSPQFMPALYPQSSEQVFLYTFCGLVLVCPIGFFMLEYNKNAVAGSPADTRTAIQGAASSTLFNPVIAAAFAGVLFNISVMAIEHVSNGDVRSGWFYLLIQSYFKVIGSAFAFPAFFLLGMSAHGRLGLLKGRFASQAVMLSVLKCALSPVLFQQLYRVFNGSATPVGDLDSNFVFLYGKPANFVLARAAYNQILFVTGTIPTSAAVALWAGQYQIEVALVSIATVVGLFGAGVMTLVAVAIAVSEHAVVVPSGFLGSCAGLSVFIGLYLALPPLLDRRMGVLANGVRETVLPVFWMFVFGVVTAAEGVSWFYCSSSGIAGHVISTVSLPPRVSCQPRHLTVPISQELWMIQMNVVLAATNELRVTASSHSARNWASQNRPSICLGFVFLVPVALQLLIMSAGGGAKEADMLLPELACTSASRSDAENFGFIAYSSIVAVTLVLMVVKLEAAHAERKLPKDLSSLHSQVPAPSDRLTISCRPKCWHSHCLPGRATQWVQTPSTRTETRTSKQAYCTSDPVSASHLLRYLSAWY